MIIYESKADNFVDLCLNDAIETEIYDAYTSKVGKVSDKEFESWKGSMQYMGKVLDSEKIPGDASIAIEFKIPLTSKRVDFIISGKDNDGNQNIIIIELKGWSFVEKNDDKEDVITTALGKGLRETAHPSYQAFTYSALIKDFSVPVQENNIFLYPCAYLYNLDITKKDNHLITAPIFSSIIKKAPAYVRGDALKLRYFISKYISKGDSGNALYDIEFGKIRPSKSLQDSLKSMLQGNDEFYLIDDQKVVHETAFEMALRSHYDNKKRVLIVKGGPGTGKSVVAINLLVRLISKDLTCQYISKNSAPRNVYSYKLKGTKTFKSSDFLFKGSGTYVNSKINEFDSLIVDEAHRLNEKSGMFKNYGNNQISEIINAAKFSVFFIDESQKVDIFDIGSKDLIMKFAKESKATIKVLELESQFRCNGSDGYLAWLDNLLEIKKTANVDFDFDYEFKVVDNPNELKEIIIKKNNEKNKARLLAGYCWNWPKESRNNLSNPDILIPEFNFSMSWNAGNTKTWAIDDESINEVGCIHTSQGLEFDYVGVIIGEDLRFEDGRVITDFTKRAKTDQSLKGIKKMFKEDSVKAKRISDEIIRNTYRTLMTRGQKGCYIYCCDKSLANYIKSKLSEK